MYIVLIVTSIVIRAGSAAEYENKSLLYKGSVDHITEVKMTAQKILAVVRLKRNAMTLWDSLTSFSDVQGEITLPPYSDSTAPWLTDNITTLSGISVKLRNSSVPLHFGVNKANDTESIHKDAKVDLPNSSTIVAAGAGLDLSATSLVETYSTWLNESTNETVGEVCTDNCTNTWPEMLSNFTAHDFAALRPGMTSKINIQHQITVEVESILLHAIGNSSAVVSPHAQLLGEIVGEISARMHQHYITGYYDMEKNESVFLPEEHARELRSYLVISVGTALGNLSRRSLTGWSNQTAKRTNELEIWTEFEHGIRTAFELNRIQNETLYTAYMVATHIRLQKLAAENCYRLNNLLQVAEFLEAVGKAVTTVMRCGNELQTREQIYFLLSHWIKSHLQIALILADVYDPSIDDRIAAAANNSATAVEHLVFRIISRNILNEPKTLELEKAGIQYARNMKTNRIVGLSILTLLHVSSSVINFWNNEDFSESLPLDWLVFSDANMNKVLEI